MGTRPNNTDAHGPARAGASAAASPVTFLLSTADAALAAAWKQAAAPPGIRLASTADLRPEHLTSGEASLVLVDAARAPAAPEALAAALASRAAACVWTGSAEALDRLGPARLAEAYDVLVTPASAATLSVRVAGWARNILRTAALDDLSRRVDGLAEQNNRLSARLAEAGAELHAVAHERERLDQAMRRIHQVARLSREINSLDLSRLVAVCIRELPALVEARRASLYLYDAATHRLTLQGHAPAYPIAERINLAESPQAPMSLAVQRGEVLLIRGFAEFQRTAEVTLDREFRQQYATESCIIAPLKGGGRVRGVLNLADKAGGGGFDEEIDLPLVEPITELIGASIYNIELYQEMERRAKTDALTNLANRRGVEEALAREADRSRRYGTRLAVLMLDVDQLKDINDRYGHPTGDAVLRGLAAVLLETVRSVDVPGRWAGDEFVVVLPDTTSAQAEQLARRLLARAQDRRIAVGTERLTASPSIGVAEYRKDESLEGLIHRADQAMYAAKSSGRGRIVVADEQG